MNWTEFFIVTSLAAVAIMSPGPSFAIVLKNSLYQGRRQGLLTAFGVALGDLTHALINLLGLGLIITQSPLIFAAIKYAGASYLTFLGLKGVFSKPQEKKEIEVKTALKAGDFWKGYFIVLLNPKAFIFFLSLFSLVVSPETQRFHKVVYSVWISLISVTWFSVVAIFFTDLKITHRLSGYLHWLERVMGLALIVIAAALLF